MLLSNIKTARNEMFKTSRLVVIFDGMGGRLTHSSVNILQAYLSKIRNVWSAFSTPLYDGYDGQSSILVHRDWLHISEATRRTMLLRRIVTTPLVFIMEADQKIVSLQNHVQLLPSIHNIVDAMLDRRAMLINAVHFTQMDVKTQDGQCYKGDHPCAWHPTLPLLSTHTFNNLPHLIRYSHYIDVVSPTVPRGYRTSPEHHANAFALSEGNWSGWLYAGPTHSVHTKTEKISSSAYGSVTGAAELSE